MHASVLDACFVHPKRSQNHHSSVASGRRSSELPCHDCPHFQIGVVGQELSHPAFAYSIQPLTYFFNSLVKAIIKLAGTK